MTTAPKAPRDSQVARGFSFNAEVKAGDVLTSLTILLSAWALFHSLERDRSTRVAEDANKVRAAAASALVKLDRWGSLQESLYEDLQPAIVEATQALEARKRKIAVSKEPDPLDREWMNAVIDTRDAFWKRITSERSRLAKQVLDEQLGTAYVDILSHFPAARPQYAAAFSKLGEIEAGVRSRFSEESQARITFYLRENHSYATASLGNALRSVARAASQELRRQSEQATEPARRYLLCVINLPDEKIGSAAHCDGQEPEKRPAPAWWPW